VVTTPKTHASTSTPKRRPSDLRPRRRRRHPAPTCLNSHDGYAPGHRHIKLKIQVFFTTQSGQKNCYESKNSHWQYHYNSLLTYRYHWFTDPGAPSRVRAALQDVINKKSQISTLTEGVSSD
jgi:hypothetical protein